MTEYRERPTASARASLSLLVFGAVFLWWIALVGAVVVTTGFALRYQSIRSYAFGTSRLTPDVHATASSRATIEQVAMKLRCRYCGTFNDAKASSCSSCGARL